MKITVNIETTEPADLIRVANALAGVMPDPSPGAAEKPKSSRATKADTPTTASAGTSHSSAQATPPADTSASFDSGPTATTAASPSDAGVTVSEADLVAAANAAVAKLGASGPTKVKEWIKQNFQQADGSPGTLKLTREDQRPALLKALQEIGQGVKAI